MMRIARRSVVIFLLALAATATLAGPPASPQRISIVAKRFSYQPDEITVQKGRPVILELTSEDVTHGLEVKELGIKATIHKGQTTEVKFTPEVAGQFQGRCSHFCGMGHGSMTLVINVVSQ